MNYETVATVSQVVALLMFFAMFAVAVAYALNPQNKKIFERASWEAARPEAPPVPIDNREKP